MYVSKLHGLGNDFLIALVDEVPADAADLARRWCHRHEGIGADGFVFGTGARTFNGEDFDGPVAFNLFNSDGSAAEISGNGMRCFGHELARHVGVEELAFVAETPAGRRGAQVELIPGSSIAQVAVAMGAVDRMALGIDFCHDVSNKICRVPGLDGFRRWATGDIGNPHIVIEVDDPSSVALDAVGPQIEGWFGGINVHVVSADTDTSTLDLRVWERGAGITEACGSGACVAAAVAIDWGLVSSPVTVRMPGGSAIVSSNSGGFTLAGPSVHVASMELRDGTSEVDAHG